MTNTHDVRNALSGFVEDQLEYGDLGLRNPDGTYTYDAAARPGWIYYRTRRGGMQTLDIAQDGGVPRVPDLPVRVEKDNLGRKIIRAGSLDPTRLTRYLGTSSPPITVGRHSHEFGFGLEDWVSSKRLRAGQVRVNADLTATISDFYYVYNRTHYYFPSTSVNLVPSIPGSSNQWRWAKICFTPITNVVTILDGSAISTATPLESDDLAAVALTGLLLPLAGVKLTNGQTTIGDESDTEACWPWAGTFDTSPGYILLRDEKSSGTDAGTFTSGAWRTRVLNTISIDTTGTVSLSSNQFILVAGTYVIRAAAPAFAVNGHQIRLQNITDASTVVTGSNAYARNASLDLTHAFIHFRFTITATKTFEIQHQCQTTVSTNGFGPGLSFGTEVYTIVELTKE